MEENTSGSHWLAVSKSPIKDGEDKVMGQMILLRDISQRKESELALRQIQEVLEKTSQIARVGGWEIKMPDYQVYWSPIIKEIFALLTSWKPSYEHFFSLIRDESAKSAIRKEMEKSMETGIHWSLECAVITAKGGEVWVKIMGEAEIVEGKCSRLFGTIQDITDKKKFEEEIILARHQAEAASVAKSEFLANMSHEIRTPLNSVIGFSELLSTTPLNESQKSYIQSVKQSGHVLLDLINDILDFSKIEAGKLEIQPVKTDLFLLVNQVMDVLRLKAHEKGLELLVHWGEQLPETVWLDPVRIKQVLINLLGNSIKFTAKGEVELSITNQGKTKSGYQRLQFAVRDTGIGIAKEKQERIFEAFSQADSSTTRQFGGTGLGLAICNRILAMMDTHLELESIEGEGSCFFFQLTLLVEVNAPPVLVFGDKKRLLLIDDNKRSRTLLEEEAKRLGFEIEGFAKGDDALQRLATIPPFVACLVNEVLPDSSGWRLVQQIREEVGIPARQLPAILLDGQKKQEEGITNHQRYFQAKLLKPIFPQQLRKLLYALVSGAMAKQGQEIRIQERSPGTSARYTFLVVDDNQLNRLLARSILLQLYPHSQVVEAEDGLQAISFFERYSPDIVLMDVQMPKMSGYEASTKIRALVTERYIPIVALTAGTVKGERERCLDAGMDDYLPKPIGMEQLAQTLGKWLESSTSGRVEIKV